MAEAVAFIIGSEQIGVLQEEAPKFPMTQLLCLALED